MFYNCKSLNRKGAEQWERERAMCIYFYVWTAEHLFYVHIWFPIDIVERENDIKAAYCSLALYSYSLSLLMNYWIGWAFSFFLCFRRVYTHTRFISEHLCLQIGWCLLYRLWAQFWRRINRDFILHTTATAAIAAVLSLVATSSSCWYFVFTPCKQQWQTLSQYERVIPRSATRIHERICDHSIHWKLNKTHSLILEFILLALFARTGFDDHILRAYFHETNALSALALSRMSNLIKRQYKLHHRT